MPEYIVADWSLRFLRSVDNTVMHCSIQSSTLATVSVEGRMEGMDDRMDGGMDYYSHIIYTPCLFICRALSPINVQSLTQSAVAMFSVTPCLDVAWCTTWPPGVSFDNVSTASQ